MAVVLAALVGGCTDGDSSSGDSGTPRVLSDVHRGHLDMDVDSTKDALDVASTPTPIPAAPSTPAPTPGETDAPEQVVPEPVPTPAPAPEPPPEPLPAAGTLVEGVQLTIYSCYGDSTGSYCPGGNSMFCGEQVYRGAAACGWQWACGQRFRIVGDPYEDMIYTCEDRGGAVTGIDVWFMDYYAPETQAWRNALPHYVTVELLP